MSENVRVARGELSENEIHMPRSAYNLEFFQINQRRFRHSELYCH